MKIFIIQLLLCVFCIILHSFSFSSVSERCQKEAFTKIPDSIREEQEVPKGFKDSVMDIKTRAETSLRRALSEEEITAISKANEAYFFKMGLRILPINFFSKLEKSAITLGNYVLKEKGFSDTEIADLRQSQVVGLPYNLGDTLLFHRNFQKINRTEEGSYFIYKEGRQIVMGQIQIKISDYKFLAKILDPKTGNIKNKIIEIDEKGAIANRREETLVYPQARSIDIIKPVFSALKVEKEILTLEEMDLFKEYPAKPSGYGPAWTKGWYEAYELLEVGQNLREKNINPHKTHIEYFARDIDKHINHIREGILSLVDKAVKSALLNHLEIIESSAKKALREKAVTYRYWLDFNRQLSRVNTVQEGGVMSFGDHLSGRGTEQAFPTLIVLPVIVENGMLGIMTINRMFPYRIYPIGLSKGPKEVGDQRMNPARFYDHDLLHTEGGLLSYNNKDRILFHSRFLKFVENLSPKKRKNVELAYFILIHEINQDFLDFPVREQSDQSLKKLLISILNRQYKKRSSLHPFINRQAPEAHIERIADDFMEMFNQIKNQ